MSGIGPLDFLFCEKCEEHIKGPPLLHLVSVNAKDLPVASRKDRVGPEIEIKYRPLCPVCTGSLIQKYIEVIVNIDNT